MSIILWQLVGSGMGIPAAIVVALLYVVSHYKMIFRNIASVLNETYCIIKNDKTKHRLWFGIPCECLG
jgi:galactokinase/mevalonate kinase-like predicted kinase